jgi:4-hydroxy-4-methyl-2-oxoglutarate aldolase
MSKSFTFGELPEAPPAAIIDELKGYEVAWISDSMELHLMDSAIRPVWRGAPRIVGPAVTVTVPPGDFLMISEALTTVRPGDVLVIDARGDTLRAVWGEYFSGWAQGLGLAGVIIDGATRDVAEIEALGFPVFARGVTARKPTMTGPGEVNVPVSCGGVCVVPGDIVVADPAGAIVLPLRHLDRVLESLRATAERERSHHGVQPGDREKYLEFYAMGFAPRVAEVRGAQAMEGDE